MVLRVFEVNKTENGTLNYNRTVKTDGNCIYYRKCFQGRHSWGHNILKHFKISVELVFTKTKGVLEVKNYAKLDIQVC